jgi:hypothetical protein
MRKLLFVFLFSIFSIPTNAQNASVEDVVYGLQTGLLGVWVHNETRIADKFALRAELGLDSGILGRGPNRSNFVMTPVITIAPRWYYNLNKRERKSKRVDGNSGNFVA